MIREITNLVVTCLETFVTNLAVAEVDLLMQIIVYFPVEIVLQAILIVSCGPDSDGAGHASLPSNSPV